MCNFIHKYALIFSLSRVEAKKYPNCGHDAWPSGVLLAVVSGVGRWAWNDEATLAGSNEAFFRHRVAQSGKAVNIYHTASWWQPDIIIFLATTSFYF